MTTLPVNEIFQSIQGEARWAGTPSVFIRLQGCAVGCPWCDTKHTWALDPRDEISVAAMRVKEADASTYARMSVADLTSVVEGFQARHVVITGGEPCDYDLRAFTEAVLASGRTVQIETSGTARVRAAGGVWVTVSPKLDMPGGLLVRDDALTRADEWKIPVGKQADVDRALAFLEGKPRPAEIWLQPLSRNPKATELCIAEATRLGFKVSVQIHAFLGLR